MVAATKLIAPAAGAGESATGAAGSTTEQFELVYNCHVPVVPEVGG